MVSERAAAPLELLALDREREALEELEEFPVVRIAFDRTHPVAGPAAAELADALHRNAPGPLLALVHDRDLQRLAERDVEK